MFDIVFGKQCCYCIGMCIEVCVGDVFIVVGDCDCVGMCIVYGFELVCDIFFFYCWCG